MIDKFFQHKGYGEMVMKELIDQIAAEPNGNEILICYQNAKQAGRSLYAKLGFVEQEIDVEGKVTALLTLNLLQNHV